MIPTIGFDPALRQTGVALLDHRGDVVWSQTIEVPKDRHLIEAVGSVAGLARMLIRSSKKSSASPLLVAIEEPWIGTARGGAFVQHRLSAVFGAVLTVAVQIAADQVVTVQPSVWKRSGYGFPIKAKRKELRGFADDLARRLWPSHFSGDRLAADRVDAALIANYVQRLTGKGDA